MNRPAARAAEAAGTTVPASTLRRLRVAEWMRPNARQLMFLWAAVAGLLATLTSVGFRHATESLHAAIAGHHGSFVESMARLAWPWRVSLLTGGGLLAGLTLQLTRRWTHRAPTGDYMEAVMLGDGLVSARVSLAKSTSALFSISSGASIGREGPLVQLATMAASLVSRWRKFSPVQSRLLVACGAAAGIASAYNAPVAGSLFVAEILMGSLAVETFGPLVFASVIATVTTRHWLGQQPLYFVPSIPGGTAWELAPLAALGIVSGVLAPLFLRGLEASPQLFHRAPAWLRPALGGLCVGLLACLSPAVCGNGHTIVNELLTHHPAWTAVATLLALKWIATTLTFGSGTVGGVFTPTLFLGAALGALFNRLCIPWWPAGPLSETTFVLVGMGAFLAGTTHAPLMAILMIFEMTLDYGVMLPLMLACVLAHQTSHALHPDSIYARALRRKGAQKFPKRLARLRVRGLMKPDPPCVDENSGFPTIAQAFIDHPITWLYVTRADREWAGAISLHDVKAFLRDPRLTGLVIAGDILTDSLPPLGADDSLEQALERFSIHHSERLPVVTADARPKVIGSLAKTDLLLALAERKSPDIP